MRISSRIYNLGFASVAKSAFESHFPNSIIPGKRKICSVKPFVHSKFDKFIKQNTIFKATQNFFHFFVADFLKLPKQS